MFIHQQLLAFSHGGSYVVSPQPDSEIMCSIDDDGSTERIVIADVSCDDAWLSMQLADVDRVVPPECR